MSSTFTKRELGRAADLVVPIAEGAVAQTLARIARIAQGHAEPLPKRPRGRGAALSPLERLSVMVALVTFSRDTRQVARLCGYHSRTVRRIVRSPEFAALDLMVSRRTLERLTRRRFGGAAKRR